MTVSLVRQMSALHRRAIVLSDKRTQQT